jgi:phytoene desaturase
MNSNNSSPPIIIIGAGIGGLSAAVHLAAAGRKVLVLEKNAATGGKMGEFHQAGFRWDTGPSVITMRSVFEALFKAAGKNLSDYLTLLPVEPLTRYFYPDGVVLDATRDLPRMLAQIQDIEPRDVEGYLQFLAHAARIHRITGPVFIYDHPPRLASFKGVPLADYPRIDPLRTMDKSIARFVQSPHLRQMLGRFATYVGANPYQAPATLNVIAHVELNQGVWYPQGGVYAINRALVKLADELGVEIRTHTSVSQILVSHSQVIGVRTNTGETVPAKAVIANVDVATVYEKLLPKQVVQAKRHKQLMEAETSCSGYILLLGVEGSYPQLQHHNIFFSPDYKTEFEDIFVRQRPPTEPTIYLAATCKTDPDHAPAGHENWFILVNSPAVGKHFDWNQEANKYRNLIFERLAGFGLDVVEKIRFEKQITPLDLEQLTGARRGALYGTSSNNRWAAFRRPPNNDPYIQGLFYAGGTTHPGGGVPMVTLSGKVAAEMTLDYCS